VIGPLVARLKLLGCHMPRMKHGVVGIVVVPPAMQDSALGIQTLECPRTGEGREYVKG
jgi:hypothetical protein